jgi:hypothetical protein
MKSPLLNLKLWFKRKIVLRRLKKVYSDKYLLRSGDIVFKRQEIYKNFLVYEKTKDVSRQEYFRGQLDLLAWLLNEPVRYKE